MQYNKNIIGKKHFILLNQSGTLMPFHNLTEKVDANYSITNPIINNHNQYSWFMMFIFPDKYWFTCNETWITLTE
jgi:hypothetical protein